MADKTKIEWAEATWNPTTGCTQVSSGCDHCYAKTLIDTRQIVNPRSTRFGHSFEEVMLHPERLDVPLHWKRPRRIFVNSLSDVWHQDVPDEFIDRIFDVMERASWHTFQVLTKRSERMRRYIHRRYAVSLCPPHIQIGVSIENNAVAWRVRQLQTARMISTAWISAEPLLGPLDAVSFDGIAWVVVGGESGPGARPMDPQWVRDIRDRCQAASIPFFFKQWGGERNKRGHDDAVLDGRRWTETPKALVFG